MPAPKKAPAKRPLPKGGAPNKLRPMRMGAKKKGGGIDLGKFAQEVSGNFAKGVGEVQKAVGGIDPLGRGASNRKAIGNALSNPATKAGGVLKYATKKK